ncbi:MAG: response regulator [Deltaproteobacteria bacterium]|nr:response regulator [Deltaproteobacteria bacterium]MBW1960042.1 response regulator [Deltaproteobacteria bacterium]MBW2151234.1 response regulator [Deltaproteobacteria bacterium]
MATIKLLLVDDEERFLNTTKILLEKRGVVTFTATNGADALKVMDEHRIDVVVLDVKMPGIDGVEVLRKSKQKHPLVEVIMLTGHASVESAVEGLKLGAFDYVKKPCDISDLIAKVNEAYDRKHAMEEKIRKAQIDKIIRHPMAVFEKE